MQLTDNWQDATIIAFDTETTGKYPLAAELCEIAAVKWQAGKVVDRFQSLIKPSKPMPEAVIKIHNITNEMVQDALSVSEVIHQFYKFIHDGFLLAHHAPFDLGFLAIEFEKQKLSLPELPVLCSSLISRRALPDSKNHKLQTLIEYLQIPKGKAHRALDDAEACLQVGVKCFEKIGNSKTMADILSFQQIKINWHDYSLNKLLQKESLKSVIEACYKEQEVNLVYEGGSKPGRERKVKPIGVVCNPNGNFLVAYDGGAKEHPKRYLLSKISASRGV